TVIEAPDLHQLYTGITGAPVPRAIFVLASFFFSSRRRHTRLQGDWSSDVCSSDLQPQLAWQRFHPTAQLASCQGGPTWVPTATELLWHAITHAPLLRSYGFRIRFLQDAAVVWGASAGVDWGEIAARLTSRELPRSDLARRWLGAVAQLCDGPKAENPLQDLPTFDLSRALTWRLTVFRLFEAAGHLAARPVWGPDAVSRGRRLLVDEATR